MSELLQEIAEYWSHRPEGYSEVNEKELAGIQHGAWLKVLEEHFPDKRKDLRILDIGTGPGFFPMILSRAGYQVTAVDYTPEMLEKAKENMEKFAAAHQEQVEFHQMDAQNLTFEDQSFDVVISRNLTWNLENPQRAYEEWARVLASGGILMNFDANWYGYLYDDEKREAYEQDRRNVEASQLDDHVEGTDVDAMERIAMRMPMSNTLRPGWDLSVLSGLGFESVEVDDRIGEAVWSEEEKLNYASTPMFGIFARK